MNNIKSAVEKHKELILETERYIWKHPETGYKEVKTSAYMAETFKNLGYDLVMADGITGFYTVLDTGKPGPEVMILAELDSIICPTHKDANPETGAVHACGHNAECAALVGIAAALKEPGMLDNLCGRIRLCAVPAEEHMEMDYRKSLRDEGKIKYFGGKTEFLSRGYFDGVDIAFMVHMSSEFSVDNGSVGCLIKKITFKGVTAHAGGAPWDGKNALYAANCGLNAINALRETFKEQDIIRIHPIITNGGTIVNGIPDKVVLESYIRGANFDAINDANRKVNRALAGAALSLGVNVEIEDVPGYAPLINDKNMIDLVCDAAEEFIPEETMKRKDFVYSICTDMGDLSAIMPVVHPYCGGTEGGLHGSEFCVKDHVKACVKNAILQLGMLNLLLQNGAERANKVIKEHKPLFASKEEYLSFVDSLNSSGDRIEYNGTDVATVKL
ncbi:MAG: amidohydrolase [Ruminococcaceae bacterium]|nr:amidohydrolase [Oscillospiraceae bacterium]